MGNLSVTQLMGEILLYKQEAHKTDNAVEAFQIYYANRFHHEHKF